VVRAYVLVKERDSLVAKVTKLQADLAGSKIVMENRDHYIASLEKKAAYDLLVLNQLKEAHCKFAEEKKTIEDALRNATLPGEDESKDMAYLDRSGLIAKIDKLERI